MKVNTWGHVKYK